MNVVAGSLVLGADDIAGSPDGVQQWLVRPLSIFDRQAADVVSTCLVLGSKWNPRPSQAAWCASPLAGVAHQVYSGSLNSWANGS